MIRKTDLKLTEGGLMEVGMLRFGSVLLWSFVGACLIALGVGLWLTAVSTVTTMPFVLLLGAISTVFAFWGSVVIISVAVRLLQPLIRNGRRGAE